MTRALSLEFLNELKNGIYRKLAERVRLDKDLDMEFRGKYINIYYQGHSILNLGKNGIVKIAPEFKGNLDVPGKLVDEDQVSRFLAQIPQIKDNVVYRPKEINENKRISRSREVEFEQLLIRTNNFEIRNNSEYIILDRQYVVNKGTDRWDLVALRWPMDNRGKPYQEGYISIIEVKYAQNSDIQNIGDQV